MKNLFSNIALSSVHGLLCSKVRGKCDAQYFAKCQSFHRKTVYFTKQNVSSKQPIRIDYLIKEKPQGTLVEIQECMRRDR